MPRQKTIIECDCGGQLEQIANTKEGTLFRVGHSNETTFFYFCNACEGLFKEIKTRIFGTPNTESSYGIKPYNGQLTKEQIKEHIPSYIGVFINSHEQEILEKAKQEQQ